MNFAKKNSAKGTVVRSFIRSMLLFQSLFAVSFAFAEDTTLLHDDFDKLDQQTWKVAGRGQVELRNGAIAIKDCFIHAPDKSWKDYQMSFRARAPQNAEQVQIWAGFRCKDRDHRYVVGLRGGNNDDLYLARYAPDGGDEFIAIEELGFHPVPGQWYDIRLVVSGTRIRVYLNDETSPRIAETDGRASFDSGGCLL